MRKVSADLRPGTAAVFALVKQASADKVVLEIAQYGAGRCRPRSALRKRNTSGQTAAPSRGGGSRRRVVRPPRPPCTEAVTGFEPV
ncbi:DUF1269 domain-containing protein [Streptomyces sp. Tu 2975]|uniref:DUF1269 domain-containing protein n=1 Tax=Streptomyces sp. Tu 2975 TaxID=2676871 RepID=UPI001FCA2EAB|nr:DUF1269 domain-containing protein [Streptomyces sp. Tu 2975]